MELYCSRLFTLVSLFDYIRGGGDEFRVHTIHRFSEYKWKTTRVDINVRGI